MLVVLDTNVLVSGLAFRAARRGAS